MMLLGCVSSPGMPLISVLRGGRRKDTPAGLRGQAALTAPVAKGNVVMVTAVKVLFTRHVTPPSVSLLTAQLLDTRLYFC